MGPVGIWVLILGPASDSELSEERESERESEENIEGETEGKIEEGEPEGKGGESDLLKCDASAPKSNARKSNASSCARLPDPLPSWLPLCNGDLVALLTFSSFCEVGWIEALEGLKAL